MIAQSWARRLAAGLAAVVALLPAAGCVSLQRGGLYRADRDTVFVEYFGNETFYRDLQFDLTERLVAEILSSPGLRLSSKGEAKVLLSGRIVGVTQRVLAEDTSREPFASDTRITVEVQLLDARTGDVLETKTLTQKGEFVPSRGEDLRFAQAEAFRFLARDIVRLLEQDF
ncbi:MAG: LPS assembly lipoprotein LptE [Planctomycetota bacterium]|jgi:hypothetical protein